MGIVEVLAPVLPAPLEQFLLHALPTPWQVVSLAPPMAAYAVAAAGFAGWLRARRGLQTAYTRKVFHFAIFTMAGIAQVVWGLPGVTIFGSLTTLLVLYGVWRGDGFAFYEAMARPKDAPRRTLFILVPLATTAAGGLISNLVFAPFAYVGYLVCGWGDAVAEPVGARWGRHRYRVPSLAGVPATRSLEGSFAVLTVGTLAAFLGLWLAGISPGPAATSALACGVCGTLVEAVSNHGLDNLTIQVVASGAAFLLLV